MLFYIGEFDKVLETFEFLCGMNDEDGSNVTRKYEDRLIIACENATISKSNLFEFIIAGEKMKLDELMSSAITLAFKCNSRSLKKHILYKDISENTKNKITRKGLPFLKITGAM